MKKQKILYWLIHMIGYTLVLISMSVVFKNNIYIDNSCYGIWGFITIIIIYILNKTLKPILVWLSLPITAITLGLFYPVINVLILKLADIILQNHFNIKGFKMVFVISIIISILNMLLENAIRVLLKETSK